MQPDTYASNNIEGLKAQNYIPIDFFPLDTNQAQPAVPDPYSIVELGKKLIESARNGDTFLVRDLMCRGAPFTADWLGTSALHFAAQNNHLETAETLLRAGISRDARTKVDRTPLHMAAYEGHYEMTNLLLNYGAEVDSRDMLRMTPLHWAVERKHADVVKILLSHGADPNAISKFNKTPISIACEICRFDFVALLQQEKNNLIPDNQNREVDEATENLMKLDSNKSQEVQQQQQQSQPIITPKKQKTSPVFKKQKISYKQVHLATGSDDEQEKEAEIAERMNSIENSTFKNVKTEFENLEQPLRLLQAHGITMIPVDNDASIVENAMESGRSVVLTEAGRLALNLTKNPPIGVKRIQMSKKGTKKIILRADQFIGQTNTPVISTTKGPNILKKLNTNNKTQKIIITPFKKDLTFTPAKATALPTKIIHTSTSNPLTLRWCNDIEQVDDDNDDDDIISSPPPSPTDTIKDVATLSKELNEARKLAAEYRKKFEMKFEEAELYKQQLINLTTQKKEIEFS